MGISATNVMPLWLVTPRGSPSKHASKRLISSSATASLVISLNWCGPVVVTKVVDGLNMFEPSPVSDSYWFLLVFIDVYWYLLIFIDACWCLLMTVDDCWWLWFTIVLTAVVEWWLWDGELVVRSAVAGGSPIDARTQLLQPGTSRGITMESWNNHGKTVA